MSRVVKKVTPVLGGFKSSNYCTERQWATSDDGTRVPISLVYHKNTPLDGTAPCLLYGCACPFPTSLSSYLLVCILFDPFFSVLPHACATLTSASSVLSGAVAPGLLPSPDLFTSFVPSISRLPAPQTLSGKARRDSKVQVGACWCVREVRGSSLAVACLAAGLCLKSSLPQCS